MRQGLIVVVLTLLVVVGAVGGGSALYILMGRTLFPALDSYDDYGPDLEPGVRVGEGYLTARDIPVAGRMGSITDMVYAELDTVAGPDIGLASAEGVAILDSACEQRAFNRIAEYVDTIHFCHRRSDNSYFVYNCYGFGEDNEAATFDLSGKQRWKFTGTEEYALLAAGDLDQDGRPEYVVAYSAEDDESTLLVLDTQGKERSRLKTASIWDMRIAERLLDGGPALVTIEDGERIVFRSERGHLVHEEPYPDLDGNLCVLDGFGDPKRQCVLVSEPGLLRVIDGTGATILNLTAPELDYPDLISAAIVAFATDSPPLLAVIAPTMDYEPTCLYLYTLDGTLAYFEVIDGYFASLLALPGDGAKPGRLLAGGEDLLREFTRAEQTPVLQTPQHDPGSS
ncbi:MAG: hypothetical protein IT364_20495 [Candidatus Hydrogenedentes bacterium]|nr:hypothetical protein [Candidatus Hydrogenedentota bacterium]